MGRKVILIAYPLYAAMLLISTFLLAGKITSAQNLLLNGDFESGGAGTGFNTNYFIASTPGTSSPREYNIVSNPFDMNNAFFSIAADHTFGNGTGRMIVVDGSGNAGDKVWELINGGSIGVQSGRTYIFSYWIRSISLSNDVSNSAIIRIYTNGTTTPPVLIAGSQTCPAGNPSPWVQVSYTWTATTNNAQIWLTDEQTNGGGAGNDFALDDITLLEDTGPLRLRYCYNGAACPGNNNGVIASWGRGGVPPYYFSLNNGAFQPISIFPLPAPSTGNQLRIIDSKIPVPDTAFSGPLTIDIPGPVNQLIISNDTSVCNVAAVNLAASGGSNYAWSANTAANIANLSSTTGANVTAAPTATTTYTVTADVPSVNLISNPGFENGDSSFYTDYTFYTSSTNQQSYGINNNAQLFNTGFPPCSAHNTGGKMMVVDGATSIRQVWSQVVSVTPNTNYTFSFFIQTLALPVPAQLNVSINGQVLGIAVAPASTCNWLQYSFNWNSGFLTLAYIDLINITTSTNGNDFALDDLSFTTECTNLQKSVTVTVGNLPVPDLSITQPTCTTPSGSVLVLSPSGLNIGYSINGVNYQPGNGFSGLAPSVYTITAKDTITGCISAGVIATINTIPSVPPAPAVVSETNCTTPVTGTITITAPLGANYVYSKDQVNYQSSPVFSGLAPSTYSISYRDNNTGCNSSAIQVTVSGVSPGPPAPTLSTPVQPTCTTPTGSVSITAPLGPNYLYSNDGVNYQANPSFSGLAPATYSITVKDNNSGCISAATQVTMNAVPALPPSPTATVTVQPSCTVPTGTVVITSPTGPNYSYGYDGVNYQPGLVFTGLQPGTYPFTVRDNNTGCISLITGVPVNPGGNTPPAPAITIVHPSCTIATGSITITNPQAGYTYSFDNGVTFQNTVTFTATGGLTYQVVVKNASGCISAATPAVVNAAPTVPPAPTGNILQPTCIVTTGAFTILTPMGLNYFYSINGSGYQPGTVFSGLTPASYNVFVQDTSNGCISIPLVIAINPPPPGPATPVINTVINNNCANSTVSVTVTSPLNVNYNYSKDGINYQASNVFNFLPAGNYSFTVKDIITGCVSASLGFSYSGGTNTAPPLVTDTIRYCQGATASTLTATGQNLQWYTTPAGGTTLPGAPLPSTVSIGSTTYYVTQTLFACESARVPITVIISAVPAAPVVSSPVNVCQGTSAAPLSPSGNNYLWYTTVSGGSGVISIIPSTTMAGSFNYYVSENNNGCEGPRTQVTVQVNAGPVLGNDKIKNICNGETVNLTAEFNTTGFATAYFLNNLPVVNPLAVNENGEYLVTATSGSGCTDSAYVLIIVRPPVAVSAGNDFTTPAGFSTPLSAQGGGGVGAFFQWNVLQPSAGVVLSNASIANPTAIFSEGTSTLQLMIMDDIGCTGFDTLVVTANQLWRQVYVPTAFTPNGDPAQLNETFKPSPQSIVSIKYFRVFNRYGQLIFETNMTGKGWDGTYQGKPQPAGNYLWVLRCINAAGKEVNLKGNVMLIR